MAQRHFRYTALDTQGAPRAGTLQADDETTARSELTRQGYLVETIVENAPTQQPIPKPDLDRRGVNIEALQLFFSQFASMNKSGVPLIQALSTLHDSNTHPALKDAIAEMRDGAQQGKPLSDTLRRYPQVFGPLPIALVHAGERAGMLERSFAQISDYLMRELRLRNKIRAATFWPKLTLFAMLAIPLIANIIVGMVAQSTGGPQIPLVNLFTKLWFMIPFVLLIVLWLVFFRFINVIPGWRRAWDRILLSIPYVGPTVTMLAMAKFSRAFGALYSAGVPMPDTVQLSADACGNTHIASQIAPAAEWVKTGGGITEALKRTGALTSVALDMVGTGEITGSMEPVLENVAMQYESEAEVRQEKLVKVLPLFLLIISAIIVIYILVSFYSGYTGVIEDYGRE